MRDLTDLPPELLNEVLSLAFGLTPRYHDGYDDDEDLEIRSLSRLLLINRKHHMTFLPLVYAHWTYNGARHSYSVLWKFLRTAIQNPNLASTVQVLNIGNWGVFPPFYLDRNHELQDQDDRLRFTPNDEETVRIAIRRAQMPRDLSTQILDAIFADVKYRTRDRRPLMALLLTSLPCVTKINAHVPMQDPFLRAVLQTAAVRQQSSLDAHPMWLPGLKELHILSEVPGYFEGSTQLSVDDVDHPSLKLDDLWPIFYLNSLHTVRLYGLDPYGLSQLLHQNVQSNGYRYECKIEHLHIATQRKSICRLEDIDALLTLPASLRSLSFSWDDDKAKTREKINGKRRNFWQISNNEVRNVILKHMRTLEYLDVYHDFPPERRTRRQTDYFGPLVQFAQLRYLSIQAEMLIGGYVEDSVAPCRLMETLPATVETLVFAVEDAGKTVPDLPLQVEEVVSQLPHLTTVELTDAWVVGRASRRGPMPAKYNPLKELCFHKGVKFSIKGICIPTLKLQHCPFPLGMRCLSQWKETYNLRIDARFRHAKMKERAKRKAAGLRETASPQPPEMTVWTSKTHVLPFRDHSGNPSFMVFESEEGTLLPPLINLNIYFTHPGGPLPQTEGLEDDLREMHAQIAAEGFDDDHYRLDVYFLPSNSNEDCIAHYQAEKAARGNSMDMLHEAEIRLNTDLPPPTTPRLPGMLEAYDDSDLSGVLFVYHERTWRDGVQRMCLISYDAGFELGQTFDERWYGLDPDAGKTLGELVSELARAEGPEPLAIYQNVTERGWTTW